MLEVVIPPTFSMLQMQSISYLVSCNHFLIKVLSDAASCSEEYQFPLKNGLYPSERFVKGLIFRGLTGLVYDAPMTPSPEMVQFMYGNSHDYMYSTVPDRQ